MKKSKESLFFTGTARFPYNTSEKRIFNIITISAEIDPNTDRIIATDTTLTLKLGQKYLNDILLNKTLYDKDFKEILRQIEEFHCTNRECIVAGLKDLKKSWEKFKGFIISSIFLMEFFVDNKWYF